MPLLAAGGHQRSLTCGFISPVSASVFPATLFLCGSLMRAFVIGFRADMDNLG